MGVADGVSTIDQPLYNLTPGRLAVASKLANYVINNKKEIGIRTPTFIRLAKRYPELFFETICVYPVIFSDDHERSKQNQTLFWQIRVVFKNTLNNKEVNTNRLASIKATVQSLVEINDEEKNCNRGKVAEKVLTLL